MGELEPTLPAVHVLHLAELVQLWNVSGERLLADVNLSLDAISSPDARISLSRFQALLERARVLTKEPGLGFPLGLKMRISAHGYLGFAAMTAATLRQAIELACEFAPTRSPVLGLRLEETAREAALVIEERCSLGSARDIVIISMLVGLWKIGGSLTGQELRGSVDIAFPEPAYFNRFRELMPGPVRFSRREHRLRFERVLLDLPLVQADPVALRLAKEHCERELAELERRGGFVARIEPLLLRREGGYRTLDELAAELHTSVRTLKRKLREHDTSYSELLEAARRARALDMLAAGASVEQVAASLGYSDAANFTRAFRRWTGRTPGASRSPPAA